MIHKYVYIFFIIIFLMMNLTEKKESILMGYIMNVGHPKIHLKEQEELGIEYVCSVMKIRVKLMKELKIKILN